MRAVLHVLATIVLVPYLILAAGFLILGHAISRGSLWSFFDALLADALWIIPWGLIGFACAVVFVAVLGIPVRVRWLGALCLGLLAAASLAVIIFMTWSHVDASELVFLLPCILILFFSGWHARVSRQPSP